MARWPRWTLTSMFVLTGANVLAVAYTVGRPYPLAAAISGVVLLAGLWRWHAAVRDADDRVVMRTMQGLGILVVLLVLLVPFLLRKLLGLP